MKDINKLITDNIDVWSSALLKKNSTGRASSKKINLIGIKSLKDLILDLAVRGKLVRQNDNHEPASIALKKIAEEKEQLKHKSKTKQKKSLASLMTSESPFKLPKGWEWVRFGDICEIERGGSPRPIKSFITNDEDGLNWIKIGDTDIGGKYITGTAEKITKDGLTKTRVVYPGDFLLTNSMSFGRPYISKIQGCIHDGWLRISPPSLLDKDYLYSLLSSPFIVKAFKKSASGAVVMNLNADKVRDVIVAVPPIEEQHCIAEKVNELMALCDQLEQQTEASIDAHKLLVEELLSTLFLPAEGSNRESAQVFEQNWARIAEHFDLLFTTEHSIEQLKQTILQLAVMGKLVPQDPNDEPASKLLEKIAQEKEQLIKDKVIKKSRSVDSIIEENCDWFFPAGWSELELQDLFRFIDYRGKNPEKSAEGKRLITAKNIRNGFIQNDPVEFISEDLYTKWMVRGFPKKQDLLFVTEGHTMGFVSLVELNYDFALAQRTICFQPYEYINTKFFLFAIMSNQFQRILSGNQTGSAAGGIKASKLKRIPLPIPPLAEQNRIVTKANALLGLCEQVKSKISNAQITQVHLAEAIVEQTLN